MAIFPSSAAKRGSATPETALGKEPGPDEFSFPAQAASAATPPARMPMREAKESVVAADLSIEGRIQGAGHVRIAGHFTGDIAVEGDLTIEPGARVKGGVRARRVVIAGELEGNIEAAQRVEIVETGAMSGDVKAATVTVAAGARMRGQVEFGWDAASAAPRAAVAAATDDSAA